MPLPTTYTWVARCPDCGGLAAYRREQQRSVGACLEDNGCWWAGEPVLPGGQEPATNGAVEEVTLGAYVIRVEPTGLGDFVWTVSSTGDASGRHDRDRSPTFEEAWRAARVYDKPLSVSLRSRCLGQGLWCSPGFASSHCLEEGKQAWSSRWNRTTLPLLPTL